MGLRMVLLVAALIGLLAPVAPASHTVSDELVGDEGQVVFSLTLCPSDFACYDPSDGFTIEPRGILEGFIDLRGRLVRFKCVKPGVATVSMPYRTGREAHLRKFNVTCSEQAKKEG